MRWLISEKVSYGQINYLKFNSDYQMFRWKSFYYAFCLIVKDFRFKKNVKQ